MTPSGDSGSAAIAAYCETIPTTLEDYRRLAQDLAEAYNRRCDEWTTMRHALQEITELPTTRQHKAWPGKPGEGRPEIMHAIVSIEEARAIARKALDES